MTTPSGFPFQERLRTSPRGPVSDLSTGGNSPQLGGGKIPRSLRILCSAFHMRSTGASRNLVAMDASPRNGAVEVGKLSERIAALAAERQELRKAGASCEALEENRVQLGRSQWALSHALIEQHRFRLASA